MALFGKNNKEDKTVVAPQAPRVKQTPPVKEEPRGSQASRVQQEATYFGKNLKITGNVSGDGDLIILGTFEGDFDLKGKLQIAEPAKIIGTINANDISVKGNIQGTITATEKIQLDQTAKVKGRISSPKISVIEGALFDGEIKMSDQSRKPWKPPVPEPKEHSTIPPVLEKK